MLRPLLLCLTAFSGALAAAPAPLHLSQEGHTVTMRQTGKVMWTQELRPDAFPADRVKWLGLSLPARNVLGRVAYVTYCFDGARLYCMTAGFDKRTGKPLFEASGIPRAMGAGQLITDFRSDPASMSFTVVDGTRLDLNTGKAVEVHFSIPSRPGCGDLNFSLGLSGRTTYDSRYAYAEQDDRCGVFIARFDWHGPTTQKPVILPKKKAPTTFRRGDFLADG